MLLKVLNKLNIKRRYAFIVFFILLAIIALNISSFFLVNDISGNWDSIKNEKNLTLQREVLHQIEDFQYSLYSRLEKITSDSGFINILKENVENSLISGSDIFDALNKYTSEDISIKILNSDLSTIAWTGKRSILPAGILKTIAATDTSFITFGSIYSYLTEVKKININKNTFYYIIGHKIISINYPLNNRYLSAEGLEKELNDHYNIKIKLHFSKITNKDVDKFNYSAIPGINKISIGTVSIEKISRDYYIEKFQSLFNKINNLLITFLMIFITILSIRWYRIIGKNLLLKGIMAIIHLSIIRIIFVLLEFPTKTFNLTVISSNLYSSPTGISFYQSIEDLLITLIFILILLLYCIYLFRSYFLNKRKNGNLNGKHPLYSSFYIIISLIFEFTLIRIYGSSLRSFVFDSNINFYDYGNFVPEISGFIMFLSIFITSIILILFTCLIFFYQIYSLCSLELPSKVSTIIYLILNPVCVILFYTLQNEPQIPLFINLVYILIVVLFTLSSYNNFINQKKIIRFSNIAILTAFTIIFSYIILNDKIQLKQKDFIQHKGEELKKPVDGYLSYLVNKTMSQISVDSNLVMVLDNFSEDIHYDEAFLQWIKSPLSQEKYNSALFMANAEGKILSLFSIGILDKDLSLFTQNIRNISQPIIYNYQIGSSSINHYIGFDPVFRMDGTKIGAIGVILASDEFIFLKDDVPEFLKNYYYEEKLSEIQNIIISEYSYNTLAISTGNYVTRDQEIPAGIGREFSENKKLSLWTTDFFENREYSTYYLAVDNDEPMKRIISISIESLDLRWHLFNIFRYLLVILVFFIILCIFIFGFKYANGDKFTFKYKDKIFISLVGLSLIPIIGLWFYTQQFITGQNTKNLTRQLDEDLDIVGNSLLKHFGNDLDSNVLINKMVLDDIKQISENTGRDFNIYLKDSLIISSRPEIYKTELVGKFLSPRAYLKMIIERKTFFSEYLTIGKYPYIVGYIPIVSRYGNTIGILSVPILYKNSILEKELAKTIAFIFGGYCVIVILIVIVGFILTKRITLPIKNLIDATKKIMEGDLDTKLSPQSKDEIGELMITFNQMKENLKNSRIEIVRIERELAWREMAKQVAHEIKNPLTPMKLSVQHLQRIFKDKGEHFESAFNKISKTLIEQIDALSRIASEFSRFAKMPTRNLVRCSINPLLHDVINLYKGENNIDFELNFSDFIPEIKADIEELKRVFINIIRNSIQAIHQKNIPKGKIEINTAFMNNEIIIRITDDGVGIASELLPKIFEPNFSTKTDGMGLGLAISKKTITDLAGEIKLFSQEGIGTEITILFKKIN